MGWTTLSSDKCVERLTESDKVLLKIWINREKHLQLFVGLIVGAACVMVGAGLAWMYFLNAYDITK